MPKQPPENRNLAQLPLGPVRVSDYTLTTNNITYSVAYTDYPAAVMKMTVDQILDSGLQTISARYPLAKKTQNKTIWQGQPARQWITDDPMTGYVLTGHSCLVSNRMYVVQLIYPATNAPSSESNRFFNSFQLR